MDRIDELLQTRLLRLCERSRDLVSPVVIHVRHFVFAFGLPLDVEVAAADGGARDSFENLK